MSHEDNPFEVGLLADPLRYALKQALPIFKASCADLITSIPLLDKTLAGGDTDALPTSFLHKLLYKLDDIFLLCQQQPTSRVVNLNRRSLVGQIEHASLPT